MDSPFGLLAELTYRCPLACAYCSNPLNMADYSDELATDEWRRVLVEARDLGVLQCHLSGGEPLLRRDLVEIVATAHELGLYSNLVTWTTCRSASRPTSRPCPTGSPGPRPSGARSRRWAWSRSWAGRSP
jgi:pyrroloquinoline quinone biosynthesis protein E